MQADYEFWQIRMDTTVLVSWMEVTYRKVKTSLRLLLPLLHLQRRQQTMIALGLFVVSEDC